MSELSKEAAKLHDIYHDYMMMRDVPEMTREGWLEIAAAALELAGVRARILKFEACASIRSESGWEADAYSNGTVSTGELPTMAASEAIELAAILLHAAQTAAAWESEGK